MTGTLEVVVVRMTTPSRFLFFSEVVPVLAGAGPVPRRVQDPPVHVRWRLAGSNQRFTGMAAAVLPGLAAAVADVEDLRARLHLLSGEVDVVAPGRWTWILRRPDGQASVHAPRLYSRRVDCRRSLELFVAQVPTAARDTTLRLPGKRQVRPRRPTAPPDSHPDVRTDPATDTDAVSGGPSEQRSDRTTEPGRYRRRSC